MGSFGEFPAYDEEAAHGVTLARAEQDEAQRKTAGDVRGTGFPAPAVQGSLATNAVSGRRTRRGSAASDDYSASNMKRILLLVQKPPAL